MDTSIIGKIVTAVLSKLTGYAYNSIQDRPVPVGISNRHLHLSRADLDTLFGAGYQLTPIKDLSQKGQYAAKETVMVAGPKGAFESVRVLGPERSRTQVEIMRSDCYKLGLTAPVRESGRLAGSGSVTLIGPKGTVTLGEGLIVAKRHIHMAPEDAQQYGVQDGEVVSLRCGEERGVVLENVVVRVNPSFVLEAHLDMDEANCADLKNGAPCYIVKSALQDKPVRVSQPAAAPQPVASAPAPAAPAVPRRIPVTLVTEDVVRSAAKKGESVYAAKSAVITPLALDALHELGVELERE